MIPITCMSNCLIRAAVYTTQKDKQFLSEGGDSSHNLVISPWTTGCYGWVSYSGCLQCMPPRKLMSFLFIFSISQIAIEKKKIDKMDAIFYQRAMYVFVAYASWKVDIHYIYFQIFNSERFYQRILYICTKYNYCRYKLC